MLIGLAGRMGAGKDTVGAYLVEHYGFRRFAFADKVKAIARRIGWNGEKDEAGRALLQNLGMAVREYLGEDAWIDGVEVSLYYDTPTNAVITDVRMLNEADWIHRCEGEVWLIERPLARGAVADQHETEVGVDEIARRGSVVEVIDNNGSLDDLYARIDELMRERGH